MTSRYFSPFPERKITSPTPKKDKRGGISPKVTFKEIKQKPGLKK
jgi:hypothetical protein